MIRKKQLAIVPLLLGLIRAAEAFFKQVPAGTKSGWD